MVPKSNKRLKTNLKFKMFLFFLALTFVFWMLIKLSKSYTTEVVFEVEFVNLPVDKVFQSKTERDIDVTILSSGFSLVNYKFNKRKLKLNTNNLAYKSGSTFYYLPNKYLSDLKLQLNDESVIQRISQDTLFVKLGFNKSKRIPIELDADIQFKLGYNFVDQLKIVPDSVDIIGPEEVLDTIFKISTKRVEMVEVSSSINKKIGLNTFENPNLSLSDLEIEIVAKVDKFTEGSLKLPFEIINVPAHLTITTFPKEVEVLYKVGLTNFSKITKENMKVICDFRQSQLNEKDYLLPKLLEQSFLISSVRFIPNKISFLVEE